MKVIVAVIMLGLVGMSLASCESCVRKATKKATSIGISAMEGVTDAIEEHGKEAAGRATDAAGEVVRGVGESIERQTADSTKVGTEQAEEAKSK